MLAPASPESYLETALTALDGPDWKPALDSIPVPVYTTDADGIVRYWNSACEDVAGRQPVAGEDRWCVTWKLHTTSGEPLPHDECPMAQALKQQRPIRDKVIIAERPDGRRLACRPYPTPLTDEGGELRGGVNVLIDVTREQSENLTAQAARCRRLARATHDVRASTILGSMAEEYDATVRTLVD